MTTIEEMDEFFDFEDAAHPLDHDHSHNDFNHLTAGPYDIDLAFAEPENDENSFTCLQHFAGDTSPDEHLSFNLQNAHQDTPVMAPHSFTAQDFTDFPRWIEGMNVPFQPCEYCRRMRIHCKVLKEGSRKGSCTSCVALARSCSLTYQPKAPVMPNDSYRCFENDEVCVPYGRSIDDSTEFDAQADWDIDGLNPDSNWVSTKATVHEMDPFSHSNSTPDLVGLRSSTENLNSDVGEKGPKVGARFSRESLRILRGWLSTHHRHPYPTEEEKESLRRQTGLNKVQITNWLANARRRGKVRAPRSTSPSPTDSNYANAMDIPRRGTPALKELNPMERWKASPPEHEPASVTAIAKAVTSSTFSSGRESPYTSYGHTDDGSARSLCNVSSTSSLGTSHSSGGSFASAFSHKSRGSLGSFGSFGNRGRRRRRRQAPKPVKASNLAIVAPRTFQCTFCTETFKTKHDWQRHEKSLHLSLERWVCSPNGPSQLCVEWNHVSCVYCGLPNPPEGHAEQHNHTSCAERSLEERTFYRKDHLRQHLNLVHDAKFQAWSMDSWKVATPEIRSRCGFCGIIMDSWSIRVDHLAEHFKGGKSMADWKGDWGFEPQVLNIVENGMPPYLIHDERNTMRPFEASKDTADSERTLEDLVKIGLVDYINDHVINGGVPTDEDLLEEGRKIILKADVATKKPHDTDASWFRDLIMLSGKNPRHSDAEKLMELGHAGLPELSWAEKLEMIESQKLKNGTNLDTIQCSKQRALMSYVNTRQALGLTPTDSELQVQACKILDDIEVTSNFKCKGAVSWFKYLIVSEPNWLAEFRRRAGLPRSSEMAVEHIRSTDETTIDYSIHNFARLEKELKDYIKVQLAAGITPTDADLQRKARLIIYKNDDPWNQTAADDPALLFVFKRQNGLAPTDEDGPDLPSLPEVFEYGMGHLSKVLPPSGLSPRTLHWDLENTGIGTPSPMSSSDMPRAPGTGEFRPTDQPLHTLIQNQPSTNTNPTQPLRYFLNDANCYGRLVRELTRFVASTMSPNNPNQHIPSDAEIQNQARWVIYDDDDPWNQTAADNAEWLIRFKRDVGLIPSNSGPGLPVAEPSWRVDFAGTGFSPPYLFPKAPPAPYVEDVPVKMEDKVYQISAKTAGKFLKSMGERWQKPATIFCSRELENGLGEYLQAEVARGVVPNDEALKAKAREILGMDETAADDLQLLEKFKALHGISTAELAGGPLPDFTLPNFTDDVSMLAEFDMELGAMDLTTDFGAGDTSGSVMGMSGIDMGGRSLGHGFVDMANMGPVAGMDGLGDLGGGQEYAERYRVHAATASPLRRRASERMAARASQSSGLAVGTSPNGSSGSGSSGTTQL